MGGAEVEDQDLVLPMIDVLSQSSSEFGKFDGVQFTEEDAVLCMIAVVAERLEDSVSAFVIGDVIGDEVMSSLGVHRVIIPTYSGTSPRSQRASKRA